MLFRRIRKGDPLSRAVSSEDINKVYDILEGIEGIGCSVNKTPSGRGWTISVEEGGGGGAGESIDFPWRVAVSGGYVTMTDGEAVDLAYGASHTYTLTAYAAAAVWIWLQFPVRDVPGQWGGVSHGASLPSSVPSSDVVIPVAQIASDGSGGYTVRHIATGEMPPLHIAQMEA